MNRGFNQKHDGKQEKISAEADFARGYKGPLDVYITIKFTNGETWRVEAKHVAAHRARFYAKDDPDTTWLSEFEFTMKDDYQLTDWMKNNMDWSDIKPYAKKFERQTKFDYDGEFCNCETDVVRNN